MLPTPFRPPVLSASQASHTADRPGRSRTVRYRLRNDHRERLLNDGVESESELVARAAQSSGEVGVRRVEDLAELRQIVETAIR